VSPDEQQLAVAIAALEAQRAFLGNEVADAALEPSKVTLPEHLV